MSFKGKENMQHHSCVVQGHMDIKPTDHMHMFLLHLLTLGRPTASSTNHNMLGHWGVS
jgi:hypothetical protein